MAQFFLELLSIIDNSSRNSICGVLMCPFYTFLDIDWIVRVEREVSVCVCLFFCIQILVLLDHFASLTHPFLVFLLNCEVDGGGYAVEDVQNILHRRFLQETKGVMNISSPKPHLV